MARFFPPQFPERDFRRGEQAVWDELQRQLPGDAVVFYSLRIPEGTSEREIYFLVALPNAGLAVLEVKGGHVERAEDGQWWSIRGHDRKRLALSPMEQAGDARHHLHRWLKEQGFKAASARTQHLVVLPHTDTKGYDAHDFRGAQVVDRTTMKHLGARTLEAVNAGDGHAPLTTDALEELTARLVPVMTTDADMSDAAELEEAGDRLAADLAERVAEWRYFDRLKVVGGAGTGKTWLAMAQARRLAKQGKRVALVCYSRGLAAFLERESASWMPRPAYVGRFHSLGQLWGGPALNEQGKSEYWEDELPRALGELAATVPVEQRFDAVVVDEGQDFGAHWWTSLEQCLRSPGLGGLYVFLDADQRVDAIAKAGHDVVSPISRWSARAEPARMS